MSDPTNNFRLQLERIAIFLGSACYLIAFNRTVPHGDALRVARQIEQSELIWNPNHLVFDPFGYVFYWLLRQCNLGVSILGSFEFISAASTIVALLIFHQTLVRIGVNRATVRAVCVTGVFVSTSFLSVALNQYYFMIQMPFLLGALYFYFDFFLSSRDGTTKNGNLYAIGVLLAIAVTIMFNNLLVLAVVGVAVALTGRHWREIRFNHSLRIWGAAAVIGVPVFLLGYLLADSTSSFFVWLLSYQGDATSKLNELYGLDWNLSDVVQAAARMGFKFFLGNTVETAGLGSALNVIALGKTMEFVPQYGRMILSLIVAPAVIFLHVGVIFFALRNLIKEPAIRFLAGWIAAYVVFNFLWNVGDEIFWLQVVPVVWLLALLSQGAVSTPVLQYQGARSWGRKQWRLYGLILVVALLLIINTLNAALPMATDEASTRQRKHEALLRDGDLEISPGWDQQKWITTDENGPEVRKLLLMNMAIAPSGSAEEIAKLPQIVAAQLESGGRVVVVRLFDPDEDLMPWYGLAEIGWPRARILATLDKFCNRPLDDIDGFVFREIYVCDKPR